MLDNRMSMLLVAIVLMSSIGLAKTATNQELKGIIKDMDKKGVVDMENATIIDSCNDSGITIISTDKGTFISSIQFNVTIPKTKECKGMMKK